jgi:hypothetical protein
MSIPWWAWLLIVVSIVYGEVILVIALLITATVYTAKAKCFVPKEKNGKRKARAKK